MAPKEQDQDSEDENLSTKWGDVATGSTVSDRETGKVYRADNMQGLWLVVLEPHEHLAEMLQFESIDSIDHMKFSIVPPE